MRRMNKIRSFKMLTPLVTPETQFIPTSELARDVVYEQFKSEGVVLPPYESFKRKFLSKRDMLVLLEDVTIKFSYMDVEYELNFAKGTCFDGASVPTIFVLGNVSKFNQYVLLASLIHDAMFALKLLSFEDANNIFSAVLRLQGLNKFAIMRYMIGVRSPIGKRLYKKSLKSNSWLKEFVKFNQISEG